MTLTKAQRVIKYTTLLAQTLNENRCRTVYVEWFNEQKKNLWW